MRLLLLSDIHANLVALEAVLRDAEKRRYTRVICLGDAVGYGPRPREVIAALRDLGAECLMGNHEAMLLGLARAHTAHGTAPLALGGESIVFQALEWQLAQLGPQELADVRAWPDGLDDPALGARFRHGTPTSLDEYTDSVTAAREAFAEWHGRLGFVGHTHIPGVYATLSAPVGEWVKFQAFTDSGSYMVPPAARVIMNPGSVGQPRDGHPQASYGVWDSARSNFEVYRVSYDIAEAQRQVQEAGLPDVLGARLVIGR